MYSSEVIFPGQRRHRVLQAAAKAPLTEAGIYAVVGEGRHKPRIERRKVHWAIILMIRQGYLRRVSGSPATYMATSKGLAELATLGDCYEEKASFIQNWPSTLFEPSRNDG